MALIKVPAKVKIVIEMLGLNAFFDICPGLPEALAALEAKQGAASGPDAKAGGVKPPPAKLSPGQSGPVPVVRGAAVSSSATTGSRPPIQPPTSSTTKPSSSTAQPDSSRFSLAPATLITTLDRSFICKGKYCGSKDSCLVHAGRSCPAKGGNAVIGEPFR